jgi:two-component system sensor histidine kinase YesM
MRGKMSLQNKIFLSSSLLLVASLMLTGWLINAISTGDAIDTSLRNTRRELALVANNLDAAISHVSDYAISIAVDSRVISQTKLNSGLPESQAERYRLRSILGSGITTIMGLNRSIYMWDLISRENTLFGVSGYDLRPVQDVLDESFYKRAYASLSVMISGPYNIRQGDKDIPVLLITKTIVDLDTRAPYGLVIFVVRESVFASMFEKNMPPNQYSSFYIIDADGRIISCSDKAFLNQPFQDVCSLSQAGLASLRETGSVVWKIDGADTLFSQAANFGSRVDWTVISRVPLDTVMQAQARISRVIYLIGTGACIAALWISFFIARSIARPIQRLAGTIRNAADGDMRVVTVPRGGHDVHTLYVGYNNLISTIDSLLKRIAAEQEEKSDYKFQLIQAQVKPHFLYNTLETIKALIDLELNETASQCTSAISTFYRLSLNKGNDILTVWDEIELSRQYMYIQKLRYIEYLDYSFDVPESMNHYLLPKMSLQPILENAIYHGIKEKQSHGTISVVGHEGQDTIVFTINDDGVGMSDQQVDQLRIAIDQESESPSENLQSFGLVSISRRIRLLYGEGYGVSIKSCLGRYTTVTVTLPKRL